MSVSLYPPPSPYPAGSAIITSTNAAWSIPSGAKHLIATIKGGDGTLHTNGTYPSGGADGGTSSVNDGTSTHSARGGVGARVFLAGNDNYTAAISGPNNGEVVQVHINPAGLSTLNVTIGSGGNGHVVISHYL